MITLEQYWEIRRLHSVEGLASPAISRQTGVPERTVRKWMNGRPYPADGAARRRASTVAPFAERILFWLSRTPGLTAVQIHQRLKEANLSVGYRSLVRWLRENRPAKARAAAARLCFEPGEAAEVDFGAGPVIPFGNTMRRTSFCAVLLCHSRALYAELIPNERQEHFLAVQQRAFGHWGGAPRRMIVDNCKCAVLEHVPGKVVYNPGFLNFCGHFGMRPTACSPLYPQSKGGVEKSVSFIKHNFLAGRTFLSLEQANAALRVWLDAANARIHRTTGRRPCDMLAEERPSLLPLPAMKYDCSQTEARVADATGRVSFERNAYSVPERLVGKTLTVKAFTDRLDIYDGDALVASHARSYGEKGDFLDPAHRDTARRAAEAARLQNLRSDFLKLGGRSGEFLRSLERGTVRPREQLSKILALGEMYGRKELADAVATAVRLDVCKAEYVEHILFSQAHRPPELRGVLHVPKADGQMELRVRLPDTGRFMPRKEDEP